MFKSFRLLAVVTALGLLLTTLFTWPFVTKISTFFSDEGDYPANAFVLWYNQDAISTGKILDRDEYFKGNQLYPYPYVFTYYENLLFPSLLFSPGYWATHNIILITNILVLLTFVFSFISIFFVIRYFLINIFNVPPNDKIFLVSFIGGIIYTFNPLTFAHFPGHFNLLQKYFLPAILLFFYKYLHQPTIKSFSLFLLFFILNLFSSYHFSIFIFVALLFFSLPYLFSHLGKHNYQYFAALLKSSLAVLIFLPLLIYFYQPYIEFSSKEGAKRSIEANIAHSAYLADWISPFPHNVLYGGFTPILNQIRAAQAGKFNYSERTLFLNILPSALFLIALVSLWKKRQKMSSNQKLFITGLIIILLTTFILSFGPIFLDLFPKFHIKLLFYYIYQLTPLFYGERAPTRFQFIFYIPFSLMISYGAWLVLQKFKTISTILFLVFIAAILVENFIYYPYNQTSIILERYIPLSKQLKFLENKNVVHLPIYTEYSPEFVKEAQYLNWAEVTKEKTFNGYISYIPPDRKILADKINNNTGEESFKILKALGLNFVVIHKNNLINYSTDSNFYRKGAVYEDNDILITNLSNYPFPVKECPESYDFTHKIIISPQVFPKEISYTVFLYNQKNCYLTNTFNHRYVKIIFNMSNKKYTSYLKLPVMIEPYQQLTLTGTAKINLLTFNNLSADTTKVWIKNL